MTKDTGPMTGVMDTHAQRRKPIELLFAPHGGLIIRVVGDFVIERQMGQEGLNMDDV